MRLAISNIGWNNEEEQAVAEYLQSVGVNLIEIAPTKRWVEPIEASDADVESYMNWWKRYGIQVAAFQSMLFSHPEYTLFEGDEARTATKKYLANFIILAGKMNAARMVFGSPKNRQKGDILKADADEIATKFFSELGDIATQNSTILCLEPNASQYNCDYITTAQEGIDLVERVDNSGLGLHLDLACMTLAGDDISKSIHDSRDILKHFHISSPMLEQVEDRPDIPHVVAARALKDINYDGIISIEMRPGVEGTNLERVKKAITFVQSTYF